MKQNKAQFIFDYYADVIGSQLDKLTQLLNAGGIAYAAEPWPDGHYRVYVKKDASGMLKILEEGVKKSAHTRENSSGMSEPSEGKV